MSYDANGNLLALDGYQFTWSDRRLTGASGAHSIAYTYDYNGIRTSKTIDGSTISYTVDENNNVIAQTDGTDTLRFVYDSNGAPVYMEYNGTVYYYEKNRQGDIVAILDTSGTTVVQYSYDIWGKLLGITGDLADTIGAINPLRYRGYYYDTETELYYLQSRYYSPELMRFISMDDAALSNAQGEPIGSNLYAYCLNNPVMNVDKTGYFSIPRTLIIFTIDTVIWAVFSSGAAAFAFLTQPVKALARYAGEAVIKAKMMGILRGATKTLMTAIFKVSTFLVPTIKKAAGWAFKSWAAKFTAAKLSQTIAGGLISITANTFLNSIVSNITVFLSIGGIIGGLWDWRSDGKLDGWIKLW